MLKRFKKKIFFENLTQVPIEKDLINFKLLTYRKKLFIQISSKCLFKNIKIFEF